jgi:glucoamylase
LDIDGSNNGKASQHDVAIVLAALHGETPDDEYFAPNDDRVLSTAMKLRADFIAKYPINQAGNTMDSEGLTLEPAIGRYPEDMYDGARNQGGNAWFLATAAFAEQAYRTRELLSSASSLAISDLNAAFYNEALTCAGSSSSVSSGNMIASSDPRFSSIVDGLKEMGDRYLRQIRKHAAADGSLSEQFKGDSGYMTGAVDLTWSYAALLSAMERR